MEKRDSTSTCNALHTSTSTCHTLHRGKGTDVEHRATLIVLGRTQQHNHFGQLFVKSLLAIRINLFQEQLGDSGVHSWSEEVCHASYVILVACVVVR